MIYCDLHDLALAAEVWRKVAGKTLILSSLFGSLRSSASSWGPAWSSREHSDPELAVRVRPGTP